MHPARKVSLRHLLMDDAAARRHTLNVAGRDGTAVAHAIAVLNGSRQDIRDGFDPAMRVPREPSQIIVGNVVAEIVQEKEWIEVGCIAESERAAKMHASAFERRLGLNDSLNGPNGHFGLLDAEVYPVISGGAKFTPLSGSDRQPAKFGELYIWQVQRPASRTQKKREGARASASHQTRQSGPNISAP